MITRPRSIIGAVMRTETGHTPATWRSLLG